MLSWFFFQKTEILLVFHFLFFSCLGMTEAEWSKESGVELDRAIEKYEGDRMSQRLTDPEKKALIEKLSDAKFKTQLETWRSHVVSLVVKRQGITSHILQSMDFYLYRELTNQIRKTVKPWILMVGNRIYVYKIVRSYIAYPSIPQGNKNLLDANNNVPHPSRKRYTSSAKNNLNQPPPPGVGGPRRNQQVQFSPHESRIINAAYENQILVDIAHWIYMPPNGGFLKPTAPQQGSNGTSGNNNSQKKGNQNHDLPSKWATTWKLTSHGMDLRVPFHKMGTLMMSMGDRRSVATLRPTFWAYEDGLDYGGYYNCQNSSVHMPQHETLAHNEMFLFPIPKTNINITNNVSNYESFGRTPVYPLNNQLNNQMGFSRSFSALKQVFESVVESSFGHRAAKLEMRCSHPSMRRKSTSTITNRSSWYKRSDKSQLAGMQSSVEMQFLPEGVPPTVFYYALGETDLSKIVQRIKDAAEPGQWHEKEFMPIVRKMIARHPKEVKTVEDAELYISTMAENNSNSSKQQKTDWTSERKRLYAQQFFSQDWLPNVGLGPYYKEEKMFLHSYILWKLLMRTRRGDFFFDSKEVFTNQRYDTNAIMWSNLQRSAETKMHVTADKALKNSLLHQTKDLNSFGTVTNPLNWKQIFGMQKMNERIACALSRGQWAVGQQIGASRVGATLSLKTTNFYTVNSSLRRANTANKQQRRSNSARKLEPAQYGRLCAAETPEGEAFGIARFQAIGSAISLTCSRASLLALIYHHFIKYQHYVPLHDLYNRALVTEDQYSDWVSQGRKLVIDGKFEAFIDDAHHFVRVLRGWRRQGLISPHISILCEDHRLVKINISPGVNVRGLLNARSLCHLILYHPEQIIQLPETYSDLMALKVIDWIRPDEEQSLALCKSWKDFLTRSSQESFSHFETEASWILGLTAGSLPFVSNNQAPRAVLGSAMMKQTFSACVNPNKISPQQHILMNPQNPLSRTRLMSDLGIHYDVETGGHMVKMGLVATDYNQEDNWDMNDDSIQLGMFGGYMLKRYIATAKPETFTRKEVFQRADTDVLGKQTGDYNKVLPETGLPEPGTVVEQGDILISKIVIERKDDDRCTSTKKDESIVMRDRYGLVVDVFDRISPTGLIHKEVVVLIPYCCECGDKFKCRHGQKGTIGVRRGGMDSFFSAVTGRVLDVHMNPIGLLGRMTCGHLVEMYQSEARAIFADYFGDATSFSEDEKKNQINLLAHLKSLGAQNLGYEVHINGATGEMTEPILVGMMYMCPLEHMVMKKSHARDIGPVTSATRQATEGKANGGGLKHGPMEVNNMQANGAVGTNQERLRDAADQFHIPFCTTPGCGGFAENSHLHNYQFCKSCWNGENVRILNSTYVNNAFFKELNAVNIRVQLNSKTDNPVATSAVPKPISLEAYAQSVKHEHDMLLLAAPDPLDYATARVKEPPPELLRKIEQMAERDTSMIPAMVEHHYQELDKKSPAETKKSGGGKTSSNKTGAKSRTIGASSSSSASSSSRSRSSTPKKTTPKPSKKQKKL
jgi:DNA-directed RNA polymerase beta subunit